ncbi:glycoside hydrolase family 95 protein, partial [Streptomyces sp. B6B3]|uniref:glycoside hydrolase family 95 protein n=1 Tax=Streptomyces sp. B6B3 TaxID=3153570 RepID=UPI00325D3280
MPPHANRRNFLALSAAGVAAGSATGTAANAHAGGWSAESRATDRDVTAADRPTAQQEHQLRLWYPDAAREWLEALPIGNGRLGAMVFGGVDAERLQLNEDTVWAGGPYDPANPDGLANLEEIRNRVFREDWSGAQSLIDSSFMGSPLGELAYQTVGDLVLTFPSGGAASDYRRELDLTTAVALTRFTRDGVTYTRETFASAADQVIAVHLTASAAGRISFTAAFESPQTTNAHSPDPLTIGLDGLSADMEGIDGQVRFRALAAAHATGGSVTSQDGTLIVNGADAVTLLVSIGTNYTSYQDLTGDQNGRALDPLTAVEGRSYDELRSRHVADYQQYFGRTALDVGSTDAAELPTDQRVAGFAGG